MKTKQLHVADDDDNDNDDHDNDEEKERNGAGKKKNGTRLPRTQFIIEKEK